MNKEFAKSIGRQDGAILVISLVILIAITLLTISSMRSSNIGLRMAQNEESRIAAVQGAQALADAIVSDPQTTPVIGGTGFTPIVNPPEVAILGVSRSSMEPVYKDGEFVPRLIMPLSLSYDHRVIDGANAARFLRWICVAVEQPFLLLLDN